MIIFFNDSGFNQLLISCNIESLTSVFPNIRDQAPQKDKGKSIKNLVGWVENVFEVQDPKNTKNKALENSISNEHVSIDVAIAFKIYFIDKITKIFAK